MSFIQGSINAACLAIPASIGTYYASIYNRTGNFSCHYNLSCKETALQNAATVGLTFLAQPLLQHLLTRANPQGANRKAIWLTTTIVATVASYKTMEVAFASDAFTSFVHKYS